MSFNNNPNTPSGNAGSPAEPDPIDTKIAQDIAIGEGLRATAAENVAAQESLRADAAASAAIRENARANAYASEYNRQAVAADFARQDRDAAVINSAIASEQASNASFGFWLLLGIVAVVLAIGGIWYANRPAIPLATTTIINRELPPSARPAATTAPIVTAVPVPVPNPATPAPRVVDRPVYVPVPVPARNDTSATRSTSAEDSSASSQASPTLHGYVEPGNADSNTASPDDSASSTENSSSGS